MNKKYQIKDIIEAIDNLLGNEKNKLKLTKEIKIPKTKALKLVNQVDDRKKQLNDIPNETEKIILQAEKYLKK